MTTNVGTADTIVGQYGSVPIDMLLKKQQQTCMYENENLVEDNLRSLLKDRTCDLPFLESDQPRGGVDEFGNSRGGFESEARINLRSGARTLTDPDLPDGTFLDHQFLEKDPRGVALGPDMRKHVEQQYERGHFYNYADDSDNSILSSGWNPYAAQMQLRNAQNVTASYAKNFSTSQDSWANGGMAPGYSVSNKQLIKQDQTIKDPVQAENMNRIDVTNNLSNDTSIGWRRTTDHRFNVAKYGQKNPLKSFTTEDWYKNRSNVNIDHDQYVSWQDSNVSKSTALLMIDLAKQKKLTQFTGLNGIEFGSGVTGKTKNRKLTPADMAGMAARPAKESRSTDAHTELDGEQNTNSGEKLKIQNVQNIGKTIINPTIVEKMSNINKRTTKENMMDLRNSVKETAETTGIHMEETNKKKQNFDFDPSYLWNSISVYKKGNSQVVKNYKAAVSKIEVGGKQLDRIDKNFNLKESYTGNQRRGKISTDKIQDINTARVDNDFGDEVAVSHMVGPMGSKKMNKYMDYEPIHNDLNDRS
jgi:hypothetical protein